MNPERQDACWHLKSSTFIVTTKIKSHSLPHLIWRNALKNVNFGFDWFDANLLGDSGAHDTAELVSGLFGGDAVDSESSLDVIDKTEVFIGLLDGDDVHESSGEVHISSHFAVNFNQSLKRFVINFRVKTSI